MVNRIPAITIVVAKFGLWFCIIMVTSGFQTIPMPKWKIDREQYRTLWIQPGESFLNHHYSDDDEDIPEDIDFGNFEPPAQTIAVLKFIISQYNSISTTYLRLQLYPVAGYDFGEPNPGDIEWSEEAAAGRTIKIAIGETQGIGDGGEARPEIGEQGELSSCAVIIAGEPTLRFLVAATAHEIGHCLGLAHAHDDKQSIMSYGGVSSGTYKLGMDDKMGITYLYPLKEEYGKEAMTLGLSCSRSN